VVLVLDDVAVPNEEARAVEGGLHPPDLTWIGDDGVLARSRLPGLRSADSPADRLAVDDLEQDLVDVNRVGTAPYYGAPGERLGVSPLLRLTPPRRLLDLEPEHVLVGHGEGIHAEATETLREAVRSARRHAPAWVWLALRRQMS
jgi:hypothetical protein